MADNKKILEVKDLSITFKTSGGDLNAIRGVSFELHKGETLAIVGESGSGKSVTVKAIMGIMSENQKVNSGEINFTYEENGQEVTRNLLTYSKKRMVNEICGQKIAMVFQDPMTSLNPVMSIGKQIAEGPRKHLGLVPTVTIGKQVSEMFRKHKGMSRKEAYERSIELLDQVGIPRARECMKEYPHQFSGGMRQRVVIAIALACNPDILICDEPTTALDVTIQAKILELIQQLQQQLNFGVIYITHDLGVVAKVADNVAVMYAGKIVERGTAHEIYYDPHHPYTWGLMSAMPDMEMEGDSLYTIPGTPPNLLHEVPGDAFALRNQYALKIDYEQEPPVFKLSDTHYVSSWLEHPSAPHVDMPRQLAERIARMKRGASAK